MKTSKRGCSEICPTAGCLNLRNKEKWYMVELIEKHWFISESNCPIRVNWSIGRHTKDQEILQSIFSEGLFQNQNLSAGRRTCTGSISPFLFHYTKTDMNIMKFSKELEVEEAEKDWKLNNDHHDFDGVMMINERMNNSHLN